MSRTGTTIGVAALLFCVSVSTCQAGLFDWLFGPRLQPQVAYYPPQVVATQTNQVLVHYAPRVRYRTQWARVPVTVEPGEEQEVELFLERREPKANR